MKDNQKKLLNILEGKFGNTNVLASEALSKHCTFGIGGNASLYLSVKEYDDLIFVYKEAFKLKVPVFILGGGTNLVISDSGFDGLVIKNSINKIRIIKYGGTVSKKNIQKGKVLIEISSGTPVNQLVRFTMDENLSGLEAFLGQPGTVGGAMFINAHNMGMGEFFGDTVKGATILTKKGEVKEVAKSYFRFGYDESILQTSGDIVLSVVIGLTGSDKKKIWDKGNEAMDHRKHTQPLGVGSSGCTFRNISKSDALRVGTPNGTTSAGYLIEAVGLKGFQVGGAKFSEKHANFILNTENAKAKDIFSLINIAKKKVKERFQIDLKEEVVSVGT